MSLGSPPLSSYVPLVPIDWQLPPIPPPGTLPIPGVPPYSLPGLDLGPNVQGGVNTAVSGLSAALASFWQRSGATIAVLALGLALLLIALLRTDQGQAAIKLAAMA